MTAINQCELPADCRASRKSDARNEQRVALANFGKLQFAPMNPTIDLLLNRRSVPPRLLAAPAPSAEQIGTILTIASRVPDHARVIPWRFVVIGPDGGARLGELIASMYLADNPAAEQAAVEFERGRLTRAPLVIAVVSTPREHPKAPEWEQILSAGAAAMNLVTAVNALGFAANWHTEWYAYDRRIMDALGLADVERIAGFVHIGTALEQPADRPRPALSAIVRVYAAEGMADYADPRPGKSREPAA